MTSLPVDWLLKSFCLVLNDWQSDLCQPLQPVLVTFGKDLFGSNKYMELKKKKMWLRVCGVATSCRCLCRKKVSKQNLWLADTLLLPSLSHLIHSNCTILCRPADINQKSWNCSPHLVSSEVFPFRFLITVASLSFEQEKKDVFWC